MYRTVFTVRGEGTFPYDMLRYDRCSPYTQEDVNRMAERDKARTVTLITYDKYKTDVAIHAERWESFGWNVMGRNVPEKVN